MNDEKTLDDLYHQLHALIHGYRDVDVSYSTMIGILELVKADIIKEAQEEDK